MKRYQRLNVSLTKKVLTAGVFGCLVAGVKNGVGKHLFGLAPMKLIETIKACKDPLTLTLH